MLPIRAASAPNCLIGGSVWDGGSSRVHVFGPPPPITAEACLRPSRAPLGMTRFDCPINVDH